MMQLADSRRASKRFDWQRSCPVAQLIRRLVDEWVLHYLPLLERAEPEELASFQKPRSGHVAVHVSRSPGVPR
jgi:hypothetical protein